MSERYSAHGAADASFEPGLTFGEVNPFSLVESVNATSRSAHRSWLIFLALLAYICVAAAGVSHRDLLLNLAVPLPFMQVSISLQRFFLAAPLILVFAHFGLLVQHVMLARKVMEFDAAVRAMEPTHLRTHPIRHELNSYFFTQIVAGPQRSRLLGAFLHALFWLSFIGLPAAVIVFLQIVYLPYHDVATTSLHRSALFADIALFCLLGVFLGSRVTSFVGALSRTVGHQPISVLTTMLLYLGILMFSFFVATIPDEPLDRFVRSLPWTTTARASEFAGAWFKRNLSVMDAAVGGHELVNRKSTSVSLRNRDLRYAELDRADLQQVDLSGTDLTGASLVGTNLQGARLSCLDVDKVRGDARLGTEDCANLTRANLARADLSHADFKFATLDGANLERSNLAGADFEHSELAGANLLGANLAGSDLKAAKLQLANFEGTALPGARLVLAQAQGANFEGADLAGANLTDASLEGANFTGADVTAVDFGAALVWQTKPPASAKATLADAAAIIIRQPSAKDIAVLKDLAKQQSEPKVAAKFGKLADQLANIAEGEAWNRGDEATGWTGLKQAALAGLVAPRERTSEYLDRLSCAAVHADGAVAAGIIRRMVDAPQKTDPALLLKQLRAGDCPAFAKLPQADILSLEVAIEKLSPQGQAAAPPTAGQVVASPPEASDAVGPMATGGPATSADPTQPR